MTTVAIVPARMASTRFPGKPLAELHGFPLVVHCCLRAQLATEVDLVVLATCDEEILTVGQHYGILSVMTSAEHSNAIDRAAEAVEVLSQEDIARPDIALVVQGDEPQVQPNVLNDLVLSLSSDPSIDITNAMVPFESMADFENYNRVKVVVDNDNNALYFSREPIPHRGPGWILDLARQQTGLIAFREPVLRWFASHKRHQVENAESIDLIRALQAGKRVRMVNSERGSFGVDTPTDLHQVAGKMRDDPILDRYQEVLSTHSQPVTLQE